MSNISVTAILFMRMLICLVLFLSECVVKMDLFVKTKIRGVTKLVSCNSNESDVFDFIVRVLKAHCITVDGDVNVDFLTNEKADVPNDDLFKVIRQFSSCACFFIELIISGETCKTITADQLANYLKFRRNCEWIFTEYERCNYLKKATRRRLMTALSELIDDEYSGNASYKEIVDICLATITLFRCFEGEDVELKRIDLLYNKRLRKGFLYDKLRYLDRSRKQHPNVEDDVDEESSQTPESTEADLLSYLKTCVVKNQSNELKQKLTESVSVRWKYLKRGMVEIKLMFPFYFADPRLILFDFDLIYKHAHSTALFSDVWDKLKVRLYELNEQGVDASGYPINDASFLDFLYLLSALPSPRNKFATSVKHFIKISENRNDDPVRMLDSRNQNVYVIAIVAKTDEETDIKYYMVAGGQIFDVPKTFSFLGVVDLFFKIHKVFHIGYHNSLKSVMVFLEHYVFKTDDSINQLTSTIQETAAKIMN